MKNAVRTILTKTPPVKVAQPAPPAAVPGWVTKTLPEHTYSLSLFESDDASVEDLRLTRAEYIALKQHLAVMRGYGVAKGLMQ